MVLQKKFFVNYYNIYSILFPIYFCGMRFAIIEHTSNANAKINKGGIKK